MVRIPGIESEADAARWQAEVRAAAGRTAPAAPASRRDLARDGAAPREPAPARATPRGGARRSKSNLGKEFELTLVRVHDLYEEQGIGSIDWVKNSWGYCPTKRLWDKLPPNMRAVAGDGGLLMRRKTKWDFAGHYRGHPVAFDAKTSGDDVFTINKFFKEHQCRALVKFKCGRSGAVAGFMFEARALARCYFVDVDSAWTLVGQVKTANFDVAWLDSHARFIIQADYRGLYDWGAVMFPHTGVSK